MTLSHGPLIKIHAAAAAEVCANFELKAKDLLKDGMDPAQFVNSLIENKKYIDAIDFMAHALPAREGIWWGCLCMQHAIGDKLSPEEKAAATAAVQFVMQPNETNGAAARGPAEFAGAGSPAGALAMAASLTGGNMAPPGAPPKPPPPFAPAKSVAMAVKIASTKTDPVNMAKVQKAYVDLALEVAEGRLI
jgi:hypothetical protein